MSSEQTALAPMNKPVFYGSAALLVLIVGASAIAPDLANGLFSDMQAGKIGRAHV